ncbi:29094_t:CDS:2, partial [Gigaspora margarita]
MSLSSEAKKRLRKSLQQQCLNQQSAEYNEAKKLFIAGKGYTVIDHLFEVYGIPNTHECIDGNQLLRLIINIDARQKLNPNNPELPFLDSEKITREDLLSQILVACTDTLYSTLGCMVSLNNFALTIQPKENYSEIWPRTFSSEKPVKQESQPINNKNALVKGANLLQVGKIGNGFINFEAQSIKECPICEVKYNKNQLYRFIEKMAILYSSAIDKNNTSQITRALASIRLDERIPKAVSTPHQFSELPGESINVKEIEDGLDAFLDFLSEEPSTTLIRSTVGTGKIKILRKILASLAQSGANLPCTIWVSYCKTLSNESEAKLKELEKFDFKVGQYQNIVADLKTREWDLIIVQVESILRLDFQGGCSCIAILDKANTTMRQMASRVHARESSNSMRDLLNIATHVVAMDVGEIVKLLYDPDKGSEAICRGLRMLQEGKHVVFVMTSCKKARALADQASKLQKPDGSFILLQVYFGQMDGKQRQDDFANIDATWSALDSKKFDIFKKPCRELIRAELSALRPGDLPTVIKGQCEWDKIADCYALNLSPAVETYIEVEYQRRLSAKYFPEILCSLIASTGATLKLILAEGTKVARKEVYHTIKNIEEKIKGADTELIVNAPDISSDEAEILKQNSICSFTDNMTLQRYYLWKIYASGNIGGKDDIRNWGMNNDDWVKLCDIDFVKRYNNPEPLQYFRRLAYFRRQ